MTKTQIFITIAIIAVTTALTRFLPFILFPSGKTPKTVLYLGKVLPAASFGLLVVYSFKDTEILTGSHGVPELIASIVVVAVHLWKKNMIFSISVGTILYMILVQFVF